jgi:tripartite-type tricarboxylate transporter receptor subunit TctC
VAELIALSKAKPGEIAYASPGNGTPNHLAMELLKQQTGIDLRHVPYRSDPLAMTDVIAGHVPILLDFVPTGAPHVRAGSVRALATTGIARSQVLPEVPTMIEAGVPGFQAQAWFGVFVAAGTPRAIIDRLHADIDAVLALPDVQTRLAASGVEITSAGPDAFGALVKADVAKWRAVIEKAGIEKLD